MEFLRLLYLALRHIDDTTQMGNLITYCGVWIYAVFFVIVFAETGLVVTPFLPGDSLLFVAGCFAALGSLNLTETILVFLAAAVLGNTTNYHIGRWMGPKALQRDGRFLKKRYLDETHAFFERYGGLTIVLSRFVPFVRTFAPFVSGVGQMNVLRFQAYNVAGGAAWVAALVLAGYFFGTQRLVKEHFSLVLLAIVGISVLPVVVGYFRARGKPAKSA